VTGLFAAIAAGFFLYAAILVRAVLDVKAPDTVLAAAAATGVLRPIHGDARLTEI
jgi:hypothetical protein